MTNETTENQSGKQTALPIFSRRTNYIDKTVQNTTPEAALGYITSKANDNKVTHYLSLDGPPKRDFKINNLALWYLACTINSECKPEVYSGLIPIAIVAEPIRSQEIRVILKRCPYTFMAFNNLDATGLCVAFQAETIPVDEAQYKAYFEASIRILKGIGITDKELGAASPNPTHPWWEGYDPDVWTDFFPIKKVSTKSQSDFTPEQINTSDTNLNSTTANVIDDLKSDRQQAESSQSNVKPNGDPAENLVTERPTVDPFPVKIFPELIQWIIQETGKHMNFRPDWIGSAILYAVCVSIGNCFGVKYKGYQQKASLFIAVVGVPGTNKSAPFEYALAPLREVDDKYFQKYREEKKNYDQWVELNKSEREKMGIQDNPVHKTLLVSDVTQEFLVQTHAQNPIGLGLFMDELAGWFKNFTRYSKGSEQEFWLSIWSFISAELGRKTTGVNKIPQPAMSVAGTIQPGVLNEIGKDGRSQNGLTDRYLYSYPDDQKRDHDTDTELDSEVTGAYQQFIKNLLSKRDTIEPDKFGKIPTTWLTFTDEALKAMRTWKNSNTDFINQTTIDAHKGILAKLDIYCLRFALIIELMDWACMDWNQGAPELTRVSKKSVDRAILLTDYFWQNAQKVFYELNERTAAERLPREQQRLFNALPDELETNEAIEIGASLIPPVSASTVKRLLKDQKLFRRVGHGEYAKLC